MMETHWRGKVVNAGLFLMPAGTCVVKETEIRPYSAPLIICKNGLWCRNSQRVNILQLNIAQFVSPSASRQPSIKQQTKLATS